MGYPSTVGAMHLKAAWLPHQRFLSDEPLPIEVWQVPKSLYDGLKQQAANDTRMHLQFFVPDGKGAMRRHNPQRGVKAQKPVRQAKKDLSKM